MATALEGVRRQLDHHKSNANRILQEIVKCSVEVKSLDTPKFQDVRAVELAPSSDLNRVRSLLDRLEFVRRAQSHLKHVKLLSTYQYQYVYLIAHLSKHVSVGFLSEPARHTLSLFENDKFLHSTRNAR